MLFTRVRSTKVADWWIWNVPLSTGLVMVTILGLAPLVGWALVEGSNFTLAVLILVFLVPILIRWPLLSTFGLYAFLLPFDGVSQLEGGASLLKGVGMLAAAVCVAAGLMERRLGRPPIAALWSGLFVVWCLLSLGWALDLDLALSRLPTMLSLFALYLAAVSIRPSRKEFYTVCVLTVIGGVLAAGLTWLFGLEGAARGRLVVAGRESNPNYLGLVLVLPLALAFAGAVGLRSTLQRAASIGASSLIGAAVFFSMSRGGLVAVICTVFILFYRLRVRWQVFVAVVILLAVAMSMPHAFLDRTMSVVTGADSTGSGRTRIWETGLQSLERFGLFGAGLENFVLVYARYVGVGPSGMGERGRVFGAHNTYLSVWVELGIIGLVLMLATIGSHLRAVQRTRRAGSGEVVLAAIEATFVGLFASAFFGDRLWTKEVWFLLILSTWAVYSLKEATEVFDARIVQQ